MSNTDDAWLAEIENRVREFCSTFRVVYRVSSRERAASFEIGCLHMLLSNYNETGTLKPQNLNPAGEFRYLTSPNGNPDNFSWLSLELHGQSFQIRQQVRVRSHLHDDIAFCPDFVVIKPLAKIQATRDIDYANGKRSFYFVTSEEVVTAHECKSLTPFPELLVSYIGIFLAAHGWFDHSNPNQFLNPRGDHLAPCLFVGGDSRPIQRRMIAALESVFPINIVSGLHASRFKLSREQNQNCSTRYLSFNQPETQSIPATRVFNFNTD